MFRSSEVFVIGNSEVLTISRQDELEKLNLQQKERQNRLKTLENVSHPALREIFCTALNLPFDFV